MVEAKIVKTPGTCGGRPRLDGHRLTVDHFVGLRKAGVMDAEILQDWDYLTQAQLDAVWAYYAAHTEEIEDILRERYRGHDLIEAAETANNVTVRQVMNTLAGLDPETRVGVLVDFNEEAICLRPGGKDWERVSTMHCGPLDPDTQQVTHAKVFLMGTRVGEEFSKRVPEISPTNARDWLLETMRNISERHYGTDWHDHLEYLLWNQLIETEPGRKVADDRITEDEKVRLRFLSQIAGGFIAHDGAGPAFIALPEWQVHYNDWLMQRC